MALHFQEPAEQSLELPHFEQDQMLHAKHLNDMNAYFSALIMSQFSESKTGGILRGFGVTLTDESGQTALVVSPGLAIDGMGQMIVLTQEQRVLLPNKPADFSPVVFVVQYQYAQARRQGNNDEDLHNYEIHTCHFKYVSTYELARDASYVELARVEYEKAERVLSTARTARDPLHPIKQELDTREAIWLGNTDVGFLRPELQRALAAEAEQALTQLKMRRLSFREAYALIPMPAFCRRGLLAREQMIQFLEIFRRFQPVEGHHNTWKTYTNGALIDLFFRFMAGLSEPSDVLLTRENSEKDVDLGEDNTATVVMRYETDRRAFKLRLQRETTGFITFNLEKYTDSDGPMDIFHSWDAAREKAFFIHSNNEIPESIDLYKAFPQERSHKEPFARCLFSRRGDVLRLTLKTYSQYTKDLWPYAHE